MNDALYNKQFQQLKINDNFYDSLGGIGEARLKDVDGKFITNKSYYISQYDAEIFFTDLNVGRIINYIKDDRRFNDWLIILIADHGESLGEEEYFFDHGYKLSPAIIKVPLIIKFPGQNKRKLRNELVSICDIYYTIADLLQLNKKIDSQVGAYGESLLYKNYWQKILHNKERMIMLNNSFNYENKKEKLFGCIWNRYKLIWNETTNERNFIA